MSAAIQRFQALPGMNLIFYTLAPVSFFIGLLVFVLYMAFPGSIPRWAGLAAVVGLVGIGLAVAGRFTQKELPDDGS